MDVPNIFKIFNLFLEKRIETFVKLCLLSSYLKHIFTFYYIFLVKKEREYS